jgi:hypothetical protein
MYYLYHQETPFIIKLNLAFLLALSLIVGAEKS